MYCNTAVVYMFILSQFWGLHTHTVLALVLAMHCYITKFRIPELYSHTILVVNGQTLLMVPRKHYTSVKYIYILAELYITIIIIIIQI